MNDLPPVSADTISSSFVQTKASKSLKITCYGSSSAKTPSLYLEEARSLGYILAKRGHVCINGAGSFGCMAAMNEGALVGDGHLIGVIHEMFLVDDGNGRKTLARDGGAHFAFDDALQASQQQKNIPDITKEGAPLRKVLVAGGKDLQERKRMLVDQAEGLVVLPGGPGTWDELWEMACTRHLGLTLNIPIVCVNIDNYYAPFQDMLERAYKDKLIHLPPEQIVHFCPSAEAAVRWLEETKAGKTSSAKAAKKIPKMLRRSSALKRSSFFSPLPSRSDYDNQDDSSSPLLPAGLLAFASGIGCGILLMMATSRRH